VLPVTPVSNKKGKSIDLVLDFDKKSFIPEEDNIFLQDEEPELPPVMAAPMVQQTVEPWGRIFRAFKKMFPQKKDSALEIIRKCIFLLSLVTLLISSGYLLYYMVWEPQQAAYKNQQYTAYFQGTADTEPVPQTPSVSYPIGMRQQFQELYQINPEVAGWLTYKSQSGDPFLNVELPVVHCDNNDKYLKTGFDGAYSRSGTLFFDANNVIAPNTSNKVNIIYGHNMASGAMFAPLNKFVGNVYRARSAPIIGLDTLYGGAQYKVFAVILSDEDANDAQYFSYLRTAFKNDADFLKYTEELKARSMFDFPVDIQAEDELLILSTCTNPSQSKLKNGRLAVVARRIRSGEAQQVNTLQIVENEDVIMPYQWYTAQGIAPHSFYEISGEAATTTTTITTTTTTTTTVTTQDGTTQKQETDQ
jgi:SrtB family sortase